MVKYNLNTKGGYRYMEGRKEHNSEQASGRLLYLDDGAKTSYGM